MYPRRYYPPQLYCPKRYERPIFAVKGTWQGTSSTKAMSAAILVFAIGVTEIRADVTRSRGICGQADFGSRADVENLDSGYDSQ